MLKGAVRLSAATFELVWQYSRLGDLPTPLFVPSAGATVAEREAVGRAALDELAGNGLIVGRDDVHEDLVEALRLLARPTDEFYGWFVRADGSVLSGLVGVHQQKAVLAVLENDRVWLSPVAPGTPAQALVGVAPRVAPVHAKSITVPANEFALPKEPVRGRRRDDFEASGSLLQGGMPSGLQVDVEKLRALVSEPDQGRAQLFAAVRDRNGRRRKSDRPIYYLDNQDGRWMLHFTTQQGGEPWLTAAAGSPEALTHALYDARRDLLN
ncbi:MAG TPA: ESX secretion-associated protein EspG [Pseudonocardiaceae bacterium]|jgi:hypothetical protein|nr:ESX secretion-associated protein EspG [Pseudonocardiaceae bacterium]